VFGKRYGHIFLTTAFWALICSAGLIQIVVDLRQGRRLQPAELFVRMPTHANLRAFETHLQDDCWLAQKLRPYVQYAQFMTLRELGDKAVVGKDGWLFYKPAVQYLVEPWPLDSAGDQSDVISAVVSFRDQLAGRGIRLLVVPAPNKASVYPDRLATQTKEKDEPVNSKTIEVIRRLQQADVEVVDLFALFKQARAALPPDGATKYYLARDSHWSPDGVRLAAKAIAQRLINLGWMEKGPTKYVLKPVTIERRGDILKMVQVPQIERQFEPEQIRCTQVISRATNHPYYNDPNSEVLVLGDSFLRIYSQDEPGVAGLVEHLAYDLGFALTAIVNDGGASTLVRQQLSRNPRLLANKKVVVWEFVERDIRFGTEGWQIVRLP
jgi:SGNH hydrolase-like domain, acetyltransferase AlgX